MRRMGKIVRKLRPSNYWCIGEHECWFSAMANEGLHLKKIGTIFAHFVKGKPEQMKYRIDALQNKAITPEQEQMYAESGWFHVTTYGMFNVFSSSVELNAPELHTDPEEQAYTLKMLDKKLALNALVSVIATLVIIGLLFMTLFIGSTPTLGLVEGGMSPIFSIIMIYVAYNAIQAAIAIRSLRKKLIDGKPINHSAPWKMKHKINLVLSTLILIWAMFAAILPYIQIVKMETQALPTTSIDIPIVRLSDMEQNPEMERETMNNDKNFDRGNSYDYTWSLLAPYQYESHESGIISGQIWRDNSGTYSPSITNIVYKLAFPSMGKSIVDELIERYSSWDSTREYVQMNHASFDLLIVHEEDAFKEIFATKGKGVMYVRYYGYGDLDRLITSTSEQISLIAK